jgi:hypothetical protein
MVRICGKAFWLFGPALTDLFIGSKPPEGFESLGEIVGHQEGLEVLFSGLMGLVGVCCDCGFLERSIHTFHLTIRPGMIGCSQPMGDGVVSTDACKDVFEGVFILLPIRQLDAIIGEYGVEFVRHSRNEIAQELGCHRLQGFRVELGVRELRRAIDGDKQGAPAFFGPHFGDVDVAVAERVGLELFLLGLGALASW